MSRTSARSAPQALTAAPIFAALGDETRLRLVMRLAADGPGSIARLSAHFTVSRQAIPKHLEVLAAAGFVRGHRQGRKHVWKLRPTRVADARACLDHIARQWHDALDRLRRLVEDLADASAGCSARAATSGYLPRYKSGNCSRR
ncbi:MAG: metalloregulator ArsR/SmtB family transcription factor [Betaproteobacteria bacterium]